MSAAPESQICRKIWELLANRKH